MFGWLRELLEIRYEFRERKTRLTKEVTQEEKVCQSCETLRQQLEIANFEKQKLLERILEKPASEPEAKEPVQITRPKNVPWNVRRQMLEAEDREKARLLREAAKPQSTEDLEKELDVAAAEREVEAKTTA